MHTTSVNVTGTNFSSENIQLNIKQSSSIKRFIRALSSEINKQTLNGIAKTRRQNHTMGPKKYHSNWDGPHNFYKKVSRSREEENQSKIQDPHYDLKYHSKLGRTIDLK